MAKDMIADDKNGLSPEKILEQLPGNIYWKNKDGMLLGCNKTTANNLGLIDSHDYYGKTDYDLFAKEEADDISIIDREVMRTNKTIITEDTIRISDGHQKIYLSHKSPLKNDKHEIIGVAGVSLDVTKKRKAQMQRAHLLENIIALIPGHVYWKDLKGNYLGCNAAQAKALGLASPKDIIYKKPYESYSFEEAQRLIQQDNDILLSRVTVTVEEPGIREDGTWGVFLTKKTPLYDDAGNLMGLLGSSFDITDMKNQERAMLEAKAHADRANQIKSDFISNMEHDIRSPFCAIATFASALRDDETDEDKKECLDYIAQSGEALLQLCNEMLEFSKLEKGAVAQLDKKFQMKKLIDRVQQLESIVAAEKELAFIIDYDETIPPVLVGDHFRLYRILINLLSNAMKFTEKGRVTLSVKCLKKQGREALVRFTIQDTGIGMPADKQQYIFERFSRLTPANAGLYYGLGVGLPIVKKFMHALEGEIDLITEEGKGTTFVCTVPLIIPLTNDFVEALPSGS